MSVFDCASPGTVASATMVTTTVPNGTRRLGLVSGRPVTLFPMSCSLPGSLLGGAAPCLLPPASCVLEGGFHTHQVVMHRCPATLVVLIGSARRPPSRSVAPSSPASSTRYRLVPSGSRNRPDPIGTTRSSSPIDDASRVNSSPLGASTRHSSSSMLSKCVCPSAKCSTAGQMTAPNAPSSNESDSTCSTRNRSAGVRGTSRRASSRVSPTACAELSTPNTVYPCLSRYTRFRPLPHPASRTVMSGVMRPFSNWSEQIDVDLTELLGQGRRSDDSCGCGA